MSQRATKPDVQLNPDNPLLIDTRLMRRVWRAIEMTDTPSWLSSVPHNFGSATAGTIKADEWRVLITVYLPLGLIAVWGAGSSHPSPEITLHARRTLDHVMCLVQAIIIACSRVLSTDSAPAYLAYMKRYIEDHKELYPDMTISPNQHMAFHIYDFLVLFGPIYSWWAFPFERLIGQLQRLPHNHRFGKLENRSSDAWVLIQLPDPGELEFTLLRAYIRGSKLRAWLGRFDCPPAIKECKRLFEKAYPSSLGTGDDPDMDEDEAELKTRQTIPSDIKSFFLVSDTRTVMRARLRRNGTIFSRPSTHVGNSLVMFYPNNDRLQSPIPGSIKYIYLRDGEFRFAVQRQLPVGADIVDGYKLYPHFRAALYSSALAGFIDEVDPSWVIYQYARYHVSEELVAVLQLSKVNFHDNSPQQSTKPSEYSTSRSRSA